MFLLRKTRHNLRVRSGTGILKVLGEAATRRHPIVGLPAETTLQRVSPPHAMLPRSGTSTCDCFPQHTHASTQQS